MSKYFPIYNGVGVTRPHPSWPQVQVPGHWSQCTQCVDDRGPTYRHFTCPMGPGPGSASSWYIPLRWGYITFLKHIHNNHFYWIYVPRRDSWNLQKISVIEMHFILNHLIHSCESKDEIYGNMLISLKLAKGGMKGFYDRWTNKQENIGSCRDWNFFLRYKRLRKDSFICTFDIWIIFLIIEIMVSFKAVKSNFLWFITCLSLD